MAIPDYQTLMLPVLRALRDGKERHIRDVINRIGDEFSLTSEERNVLLPSGKQKMFDNRVGWAKTYLKKAGLIESVKRGYVRISEGGSEELKRNPGKIDVNYLGSSAYRVGKHVGCNRISPSIIKGVMLFPSLENLS
jgi:restriction system protein